MTYTARFRHPVAAIIITLFVVASTALAEPIDVAKLYPRTKEEIRIKLSEIERRKYQPPPYQMGQITKVTVDPRVAEAQQKGLNELNTYRFLSGVSDNVAIDMEMVSQAQKAAEACKAAGRISHDLGNFTDACNLHSGGKIDNASQVRGYIEDGGANNRERRGHRMWCLNPALTKTGFGIASGFAGMHVKDAWNSGVSNSDSWAYPGKGWFPRNRLHGDGWSLYLKGDAPAASDVKVRMWKLLRAPKEALQNPDAPYGKEIKIKAVFTQRNSINFEPDIVPNKDCYWISIEGPGVSEKYLVDLF